MSEVVISAEGLAKRYKIGNRRSRRAATDTSQHEFWALQDLSFEVRDGEVLGIVGRNGAGKTTLLKILARITEPTKGSVRLTGRVGALLEVGTGFHPELTGRENVFLNGGILGMSRSEIRGKFDEIVAFSEIERFIDTPVKRYSSGMYVRLAFAVAAHFEPEILVIDEVLAVGDIAFQKKCLGKMHEVATQGRTVLFVSHNTGAVVELCTRAILLEGGRKVAEGPVDQVIDTYSQLLGSNAGASSAFEADPNLAASLLEVSVRSTTDAEQTGFDIADGIEIAVRYRITERLPGLAVALTLSRNSVPLLHAWSSESIPDGEVAEPGTYVANYTLPGMFLKGGFYTLGVTIGTPETLYQDFREVVAFEIDELRTNSHSRSYRRDRPGHIISPGSWRAEQIDSGRDVKVPLK